ncbi:unnamed protein product [Closterium sp. Naga37s-1]|nr:unnamed protein product [Closterium sp. Naga37s-1]
MQEPSRTLQQRIQGNSRARQLTTFLRLSSHLSHNTLQAVWKKGDSTGDSDRSPPPVVDVSTTAADKEENADTSDKSKHLVYSHYTFFTDPNKKVKQVKCDFCGKTFSFTSVRCASHLAIWNNPNTRREVGPICKNVPKRVSDEIRALMEGKIAARKDKEKAAEAAISSVSGKSAAGPKPKRGRMEDFYGDEGLSSKRNADEAICLYFAGMRVAERQCENPLFLNMLRAVTAAGPNYVPPKRDYVGGAGLLACKKRIEKGLAPITDTWAKTGVTIASNMMTDKSGRAQMNILLLNDAGAVFVEAVDCKMELKSGAFVAGILRPIIKKIGPENVVALCMDGGSNYASACKLLQAEWPHIEHVPCATHVLDLLMEDIGKMEWARDVVGRAGDMITFLRIHLWTRAFLRSPELHGGKALQPLRPVGTRFGTQYIAVSRLCQLRSQLLQMVVHDGWKKMKGKKGKKGTKEKKTTACDFEAWVMDVDWWEKAGFFVQLMEVPFMVMRTDSQAKGMMGAIYDIMLQLTEDMAKLLDGDMCKLKEEEKVEVQEHLRRRWDESLACPLHVVGRILNPANQLEEIFLRDVECTKVMREWLARSKVFVDKFWKGKKGPHKSLQEGMLAYINATGSFGSEEARLGREELQDRKGDVLAWWQYHGWEYADLAGLARHALSQQVSAAPCERNWSVWDGVHTARRNRLGSEKVRDLVYVAHNWTVVHNHHKGAAVAGPSGVGRKGGIVEGNIPTPPLPEGYKLEEDGEVEEDEDAICVDEHAHQEDGEEEEEGEEEEGGEDED